jgi:hypothetical protein
MAPSCLGMLIDGMNKRHYVWQPAVPSLRSDPAGTVSLETLFTRAQFPAPTNKERLILGVKLASSVIQLHNTDWLNERWGTSDIMFFRDLDNSDKPMLEKPLVRRCFGASSEEGSVPQALGSRVVRCNRTLFSLGVILLEIWYWNRLESLCGGVDGSKSDGWTDTEVFNAADGVMDRLYDDAGLSYGDAVRRCIRGLDHRDTNLENDEFKREVCRNVVYPLEVTLKGYCPVI